MHAPRSPFDANVRPRSVIASRAGPAVLRKAYGPVASTPAMLRHGRPYAPRPVANFELLLTQVDPGPLGGDAEQPSEPPVRRSKRNGKRVGMSGMVDDRRGVSGHVLGELPRLVNGATLDRGQLGYVAADVRAVGVEAMRLPERVERPAAGAGSLPCRRPTASCRRCWRRRRRRASRRSVALPRASRRAGRARGTTP